MYAVRTVADEDAVLATMGDGCLGTVGLEADDVVAQAEAATSDALYA